MDAAAAGAADPAPAIVAWMAAASLRQQWVLDKSTPHVLPRWLALGVVAAVYALRVYFLQGFYIVSYGLAILNLLIGFLTPLANPAFDDGGGGDAGGPLLPTRGSDEFRPFVRRLAGLRVEFGSGIGLDLVLYYKGFLHCLSDDILRCV